MENVVCSSFLSRIKMGQAPITEFSKCGTLTVLLQVSNFLNVITILVS
jgi:hypothetical protein